MPSVGQPPAFSRATEQRAGPWGACRQLAVPSLRRAGPVPGPRELAGWGAALHRRSSVSRGLNPTASPKSRRAYDCTAP